MQDIAGAQQCAAHRYKGLIVARDGGTCDLARHRQLADGSFFGGWIAPALALAVLERECEWEVPHARPAFAQGMVAGLPVKLWFESERVLVLVAAPFAHDLAERFVA